MKKFMFTAIAMVAFVGSSMANTIEIEYKIQTLEVEALDSGGPVRELTLMDPYLGCFAAESAVILKATEMNLSAEQADDLGATAYNACVNAIDG